MIETLNTAASPTRFANLAARMPLPAEKLPAEKLSVSVADELDDYASSVDDDIEYEVDNISQADKDKLNTRLLRILKDNTVGAGLDG